MAVLQWPGLRRPPACPARWPHAALVGGTLVAVILSFGFGTPAWAAAPQEDGAPAQDPAAREAELERIMKDKGKRKGKKEAQGTVKARSAPGGDEDPGQPPAQERIKAQGSGRHHHHHHHDHDHGAAVAEHLPGHVDPRTEAPRGPILVSVSGDRLVPEHVRDVEAALGDGLRRHPGVEPIAASAAKVWTAEEQPECARSDRCAARLAVAVGARYVVRCVAQVGDDSERYVLDLYDLSRAEVIAREERTLTPRESLDALVDAASALLEGAQPVVQAPPMEIETGTDWQPFGTRVPFFTGVGATGVAALGALFTTAQFMVRQADYNRLARGGGTIRGEQLVALGGQVRTLADVANGLWAATAGAALGTVVLGILTDWDGRTPQLAPAVLPSGGGLSLGGAF